MKFKDYYAALGLKKGVSQNEIKRAFRKLARQHHPDVNPGDVAAERRFKEINEANEVLGDPERRGKYDELGANWRMYEQAGTGGASPFGSGAPFGANRPGRSPRGFRNISPEEAEEIFGGGSPFSDFFQTHFSGGAPGGAPRRQRARQGRDLEHPISLTLEETYDGTTRRLSLDGIERTQRVEVKIPPGVNDGARVRVAGKGEQGTGNAAAGDLFLRVQQTPHSRFTRRGQDLHLGVMVPIPTAVLGGGVPVPRLRGTPLTLKIPAGTRGGQVFRLKGHGMPASDAPETYGDLYATVQLRVPERLTASERQHYEALAALDERSDS